MSWLTRYFLGVAAGFALVFFLLGLLVDRAMAQDHHVIGHARYHAEYMWWKQPGSQASCCNARVTYPNGAFIGDCYPTEARPVIAEGKFDHWQALRAKEDGGGWIDIPDAKVIREKNPDPSGRDAHLCYGFGAVLCFVPPAGTM